MLEFGYDRKPTYLLFSRNLTIPYWKTKYCSPVPEGTKPHAYEDCA
jgi:hypothetical protein